MKKVEAAEFLRVSTRTLERRAAEWGLTVTHIQGRRAVQAYYDEQELEKVKAARSKPIQVRRPGGSRQRVAEDLPAREFPPQLTQLLATLAHAPLIPDSPPKLFLSLTEVAVLLSIPLTKLRSDAKNGILKTIKSVGRGLGKVRRDELENYIKQLK